MKAKAAGSGLPLLPIIPVVETVHGCPRLPLVIASEQPCWLYPDPEVVFQAGLNVPDPIYAHPGLL